MLGVTPILNCLEFLDDQFYKDWDAAKENLDAGIYPTKLYPHQDYIKEEKPPSE